MSDRVALEWPMFADCALPYDCECARRIDPRWEATACMVPGINALAVQLGLPIPYPTAKPGTSS